jgi:di/tricarboxylate transporter
VPFFRSLDRVDIARLLGVLERVEYPAGTQIFAEGAQADALYLLAGGRVEITVRTQGGERSVARLDGPSHFGELGILLSYRTASARAITDVQAWTLPRDRFEQMIRERAAVGLAVARSLARLTEERSYQQAGTAAPSRPRDDGLPATPRVPRPRAWRQAGAVLAVLLPAVLWLIPPWGGLTAQGWRIGVIALGAAVAWLFEPAPDFVIALAMVTAWGLAGLVPVSLAFAGFSDPTWVFAFGTVGLAAAMARSGLLFRLALALIRIAPRTHAGRLLALLAGGVVMTPLVPMAAARVATTSLLAQELAHGLGYPDRSRASAGLAFAGLIGYSSFSSIFLTGLATNFFVLGLLPPPDRARFDWLHWLAGAAPAGIVMFAGALVAMLVVFRPEVAPRINVEMLAHQERALGPLSRHEWITIAALCILLLGLFLPASLRINTAWLSAAALVMSLAGGVIDRVAFRTSIEWGFVVLFGVLVGTGGVFRSVGIDRRIAEFLMPVAHAVGHPAAFVGLLAVFVALCRLVLPRIPTNFLLSLALMPVAPSLGLEPWLIGFVVLTVGNTWLLPSLSDFNILIRDATRGEMFTDRDSMLAGAAITVVTLLAIALSIPYWRALGFIAR